MPVYEYKCTKCEARRDITKPVAELDRQEWCVECTQRMKRQVSIPRVHSDSYHKPIHSDALAIHPSQREEHMKKYPDVKLDNENRPILDSYKKHDEYLEKRGVYKPPGRKRRKGTKIAPTKGTK